MTEHYNPQLQLANDFVQYTNKSIFLTGKAGTGKTTFLHNLKKTSPKRMVVVAPTGVAAINAGGVTIHSFFQLAFGPHIPLSELDVNNQPNVNQPNPSHKKFNREKINIIKGLDLLVIDEISMVRADMLDAIDEVLKKYKDRTKPFGGVQLLMIGDLHQLSPVIKDEEWNILKNYYETVYFFSSKALKQTQSVSIELKHIYRQTDTYFIDMLNQIRNNKIEPKTLEELNSRYIPGFSAEDNEGYIILTTHNANAHQINETKLKKIKLSSKKFKAEIKDDFPEYSYPTELDLELKIGAQVMFVKNDSSGAKLFYNGKIGKVTRIEDEIIYVKCPADTAEIPVNKEEWQNVKYFLDDVTKEIKENVIGVFTQYPLKLAWAITIHKSQGLTFEKAIIDANASFAHGQVYVALSRCKTFEGLVLSSQITMRSVKTDNTVSEFSDDVRNNEPDEKQLEESKIAYQQSLLYELFDFKSIKSRFSYLQKILNDSDNIIQRTLLDDIKHKGGIAETEIYIIADKFKMQLVQIFSTIHLPEESSEIQDRIKKAAIYFAEKTESILFSFVTEISFDIDNKEIKKTLNDILEKLQKDIFVKLTSLKFCINGFETLAYIKAKANADIDFKSSVKTKQNTKFEGVKDSPHSSLYIELKNWRKMLAEENNSDEYMILPFKAMQELTKYLPTTIGELRGIKGIGEKKVMQFGHDIIEIISSFCERNNIDKQKIEFKVKSPKLKAEKKEKVDSKKLSFDLFKSGKSIDEIALERNFSKSTIEGHLAHYVGIGKLDIFDVVTKAKIDAVTDYINQSKSKSVVNAKTALDDNISYAELRFVFKYLEFMANEGN